MRTIEIEEDIYAYLCSQTQEFGEEPSAILRRLLCLDAADGSQQPIRPRAPSPDSDTPAEITDDTSAEPPSSDDDPFEEHTPRQHAPDEPSRAPQTTPEFTEFLNTSAFIRQRKALGRLFAILSWLYQRHGEEFEEVASVRGRHRTYFAKDPEDIKRTGSSTKPQLIPKTPWYVTTNTSTKLKQAILRKLLSRLGYGKDDIEQATALVDPRRRWTY